MPDPAAVEDMLNSVVAMTKNTTGSKTMELVVKSGRCTVMSKSELSSEHNQREHSLFHKSGVAAKTICELATFTFVQMPIKSCYTSPHGGVYS